MTAPRDANDVLFGGGGAPALQWQNPTSGQDYPVGTFYEGEIVRTSAMAQRNIRDKSQIDRWPDGSIKYIALITIQTDLRDPSVPEDDGQRTLWVSGKYLTNAVKAAVKAAGKRETEEGGWLKVTLSGYGQPQPGFRPPRLFEVVYKPPTPEKQAEVRARKDAQASYSQASQFGDPSDPWASPQNAFPQADPWGTVQQPQQPVQPVQPQPPVGGFDSSHATPASVANAMGDGQMDLSGLSPEARASVETMLAKQQGGQQ